MEIYYSVLYNKEYKNFKILLKKKGFLNKYNCLIRIMYLKYLEVNFAVPDKKVHQYLQLFLISKEGLSQEVAKNIISARHNLKYNNKYPDNKIIEIVNFILNKYSCM